VNGIVYPAVERYAEEHTTPPEPQLAALAEETRQTLTAPAMLTGTVEGRFLQTLVFFAQPRRVLELGTYSGYSALSMAAALPPDGRLITCELSEERAAVARRYFEASPWADRIELRLGPALETLDELQGPFDLVFIDADKGNYLAYYERAIELLSAHGLIVADNTLWSGRVVEVDGEPAPEGDGGEGEEPTPETRALREFNAHVRRDPRVVSVMLTVRDGITLIRRAAP
jgi:caffeoyl-CoA O-methyltransferase